jgi:zinc protease
MMFKSTKNLPAESFDRMTEDVGGYNNASTHDDFTNYYEVVPSNHLERLLWAEAERMANLNVDEATFKSERDVVKEEFRSRVLAEPYGRLFYLYLDQLSFSTHPYKRPGIGSIEDLDAASIEDVRNFFRTYYRPDNATLIVAGDFDPKEFDAWVDKYFGRIAKPDTAMPRVSITEPARTAEKRYTGYGENVPLPAVAITYLAPPAYSDDAAPLQVAETILSGGDSSRLYQALIYDQQIALNAFTSANLREDQGYFWFGAILAQGKKPEDGEKSLLAELRKVQDAPVSAAELEKAKNQLVTSALQSRETNDGKASELANAAVMLRDPARVNTEISRLQAVTAADVQRVMKKYFTDTNRVVIYYLPESMRPAGGQGK